MADKPSSRFRLNSADVDRWVHNLKIFLIPVSTIYLTSLLATFTVPTNIVELSDFIPSEMVKGGIAVYAINGLLDITRKFVSK